MAIKFLGRMVSIYQLKVDVLWPSFHARRAQHMLLAFARTSLLTRSPEHQRRHESNSDSVHTLHVRNREIFFRFIVPANQPTLPTLPKITYLYLICSMSLAVVKIAAIGRTGPGRRRRRSSGRHRCRSSGFRRGHH